MKITPLNTAILLIITLALALLGPHLLPLPPELLALLGYALGLPVPLLEALRGRPLVPAQVVQEQPHMRSAREQVITELLEHQVVATTAAGAVARAEAQREILRLLGRLRELSVALLLVLLGALPSCSPATTAAARRYGEAIAACGARLVPKALQDGVSLALHGGEGWRGELVRLGLDWGACLVDAEVLRYTLGPEASTSSRSSALGAEGPGNLGDLAQERAQLWLRERER